ncbi:MAG: DUF4145 domain-containing protein [Deltaproteobacteria bacterium]|nr:DUF4145 domain-containing protein [Deltaproteobacteria bacterium]
MSRKSNPPSINATAFDCPYCHAFTTQNWFDVRAWRIDKGTRTPFIYTETFFKQKITEIHSAKEISTETKQKISVSHKRWLDGEVFLNEIENHIVNLDVINLFLSQCYNCDKVAVWVHDRLIYPSESHGAIPNADLPEEILRDYEEARTILNLSPRGAAALLRLCIQKLCRHLGENGKNIDHDIAALVAKGLNPLVQKSLDVVRVIGNEAVHPGVMDISDDRDTAARLFDLVNIIADQMITHPKVVNTMYEKLPESKRAAIDERDGNDIR